MTPNLTLAVVAGVLVACGIYLLLARSVVHALLGFLLMGNGINLLFIIASGPAGDVPIVGVGRPGAMADPVPQALVLTAIVISLAMTAFVLALAHRAWQLTGSDLFDDDEESARIRRKAELNDYDEVSAGDAVAEISSEFVPEDSDS